MARQNEPPDDDPANDNYKNLGDPLQETLIQLQMLEHIENSPRGLSQEDRALKERLEKRERDLRAIDIKDVNEALASRWFTAELTLQSHARISGDALHLSDNPQRVVAELLKDVIHYCQTRSEGVPLDSPEHLDFDKLVKIARQELRAEMRPAPQISEQRTPEPDMVSEKDDPELETLLKALEERQAKERENLDRSHQRSIEDSNNNPDVVAECTYLANAFEMHQREETEHYIADFYKAREMREQLRLDAGGEKREHGIEQDGPTLSE